MYGELFLKILEGIEFVARIEILVVLAMRAFDLSVVPRRIRTDFLVLDAFFTKELFEHGFVAWLCL